MISLMGYITVEKNTWYKHINIDYRYILITWVGKKYIAIDAYMGPELIGKPTITLENLNHFYKKCEPPS